MADDSTTATTTTNEASYVSYNQLADAAMFITIAMRLIEKTDGEAWCSLHKAHAEIIAAQDYLERIDPIASPIDRSVSAMLARIGESH